MALTITKNQTLQGVIHLNESVPAVYQYFFELPTQNYPNALPNALDNQVLEEVYIIVDHPYGTRLFLPSISSLRGAWNLKIYVVNNNIGFPTLEVMSYSNETSADTINGSQIVSVDYYKGASSFHPIENNMWMRLSANGIIP